MQLQVKQEKMLIAGQWIAAEQTFDVFDPQDNRLIAKVPLATENDMLMAIEKADEAYLNNLANLCKNGCASTSII